MICLVFKAVVIICDDVLILLWHPHPFPTAQNRLNRTYLRSYRVNLPWCVYHLTHTQHSNNLIILYPLDRLFQLQSPFSSKQFHLLSRSFSADNLFIYSNHLQQTSPSICKTCTSFIHPALCHPRKMSLSSSIILHPKLSRKDSFSHFRPLPYIPHEKWGYHHLQTSTQSFLGNIGFGRVF